MVLVYSETSLNQAIDEQIFRFCGFFFQHFNPKGNRVLGVLVATTLKRLLSKAKPRGLTNACNLICLFHLLNDFPFKSLKCCFFSNLGQFSAPKAPELSAREGINTFLCVECSGENRRQNQCLLTILKSN